MTDKEGRLHQALLRNAVRNGRKTIELTSTVSVSNFMEQPIFVSFKDTASDMHHDVELQHRVAEFCPLRYAHTAEIHLHVGEYEGSQISVDTITSKALAACVNLGDSEHPLYARAIIKEDTVYDAFNKDCISVFTLTLVPVMSIMNLLPVNMEYHVYDADTKIAEGAIKEGEEIKFNGAAILAQERKDVKLRIAIRPDGFEEFSNPSESIIPFPMEKPQSVSLKDSEGHTLRLTYKAVCSNLGVTTLEVYCDFWLVNCTGETITVMEREKMNPNSGCCLRFQHRLCLLKTSISIRVRI